MNMTSIDNHGLFLIKINTTFANRQFGTFSSPQILLKYIHVYIFIIRVSNVMLP